VHRSQNKGDRNDRQDAQTSHAFTILFTLITFEPAPLHISHCCCEKRHMQSEPATYTHVLRAISTMREQLEHLGTEKGKSKTQMVQKKRVVWEDSARCLLQPALLYRSTFILSALNFKFSSAIPPQMKCNCDTDVLRFHHKRNATPAKM